MAIPTTVREVRSFIGMYSYYRRFIAIFWKIAISLIRLTKKLQNLNRLNNVKLILNILKKPQIHMSVILSIYKRPYILYTNATEEYIDVCLC